LLSTIFVEATHIVGGEIYYQLLNATTNSYRVTVNVYFDCYNGDPDAIDSDKTIFISTWDAKTNNFISDFTLRGSAPNRLKSTNYECVKQPSGVCTDAYVYTAVRTINPGTNGVILAWQRCCRNNTIDNIVSPEASGFTAWTVIPPKSTANSSAYFTTVPPVYICVDAPLTLQQPAIDPDGDSLVYLLTTPYLGANQNSPRPSSAGAYDRPPFSELNWSASYSEFMQMKGSPSLNMNSSTGEITITPSETGQFVVGFTVQEYRNGKLIGETRRDYQFNVIQCEFDILANFDMPNGTTVGGAYTFECGDTVCIRNKSYTKFPAKTKYFWDFGDPTTTSDTLTTFSLAGNICYTYPGNGNYTISLKATTSICESNYKYDVRIRSTKSFDLGPDLIFCDDFSIRLDTKTADAVSVKWNTGQTGYRINVSDTGRYVATVSYGNCSYVDSVQLRYDKVPPVSLPRDSLLCDTVNVTLDVGVPGLFYQWSTSPLDNKQTINVRDTGEYSVIVRNANCFSYDTIRIWTATIPDIDDQFYCNEFTFEAEATSIEEAEYKWSTGETTQKVTLTKADNYWVQVKQRYCVKTDSFKITNPIINLDLGIDRHFCDNINLELDAGPDGIKYDWSNGATIQKIKVNVPDTFRVTVYDEYGCKAADSVIITVSQSPEVDLGDDLTICVNSPTKIEGPAGYAYQWNTGSKDQSITTMAQGKYTLKIIDQFGCMAMDSLFITVDPEALPNELNVPSAFSPNDDGLNELFPFALPVSQPSYYITIFSRWGEKVFDSRDDSTKPNWDGYYQGEKVPNQLYIYFMYYRGCDGNARTAKGNVYPLR
jgi:gliding motility-associated-like protein